MPITRQTYFQPTQITGCSHWLDATDSSTITLSSGSLTQWNDKSGNGRNLTAVSGYANATVSSAFQNGLNVFNFFGNGLYRTALGNVSYPLEVYIIVALKSLTTHVDVLGMGDTATDNFNSLTFSESAARRWHNGSSYGNRQTISTTDETSLSFLLIQWSIANGNYLLRRNGTQLIQASQTYSFNNSATAAFQIGFRHTNIDAANFSGYIGEIVVFNNQIGTTDRQNVESYLAQKWGLTGSLPAGHPGLTSIVYRNLQTTFTKKQYYTAFSPRQIGGCTLWLDGADSATTTSITSGVWTDKSGGGFNTSYVAGGTGLTMGSINRLPAVTFPGGDNNAINSSAATSTTNGFSIFFVASRSNSSPTGARFITNTSSSLQIYGIAPDIVSTYVNNLFSSTSLTIVTGVPFIFSLVVSPSTFSQWINGTVNSSTGTTGFAAGSTIVIGASGTSYTSPFVFAGQMGEILVFNSAITTTQRQQVESYLAQKWGLTSSLIAGHLNATFPAGSPTAIQSFVPAIRTALTYAALPTSTLKYTYTGSNQSFVVPSGITSVTVYLWGAGGGAGLGGGGGAGCYVQGVLTVIPGETLTIVVGQGGGNKARALGKTYGGGGAGGGPDGGRSDIPSSQGGGRSAIVRSSTDLVTAAAGGGGRGGRGGRGRLVTGENGTGAATGGTQSAGGTNNGGLYTGGDANQDNSAAGGSGYYGGGGGGQDQAGGGGSCLTSNLALIPGQSTFGTESSNGVLAPQTSSPYYNSDVAFGATSSYGYNYGSGGNGLVVITYSSKTVAASLSYSRIILSAWYGSVAYRYGLDVTTAVNNAFGGNPSNTITLSLATFTDPQVGTTKYTYIVYMFNGIQKFSSAYAEGTVLIFSSLT